MAGIKYWLWLCGLRGLGNPARLELLAHFGDPEAYTMLTARSIFRCRV